MQYAKTETYEHTISGLLTKRAELLGEAETLWGRIVEIKNDLDALDRILVGTFGYEVNLDAQKPRQKRHVVFGRGELTKAFLNVLRRNAKPMTAREIAQEMISQSGFDARDRRYVKEMSDRCARAAREQMEKGTVRQATDM